MKIFHFLTSKKGIAYFVVAFCALFFIPYPETQRQLFWGAITDVGHIPIFYFLFFILYFNFFQQEFFLKRVLKTFFLGLLVAGGIEVLQPLFNRSAQFIDVRNGCFGLLLGGVGILVYRKCSHVVGWVFYGFCWILLVGFSLIPAYRYHRAYQWSELHSPLLSDFETDAQLLFWKETLGGSYSVVFQEQLQSHALKVVTKEGDYSGVQFTPGEEHWGDFQFFSFKVFNPGEAFSLGLRVDDSRDVEKYEDRFTRTIFITKGINQIKIPLSEIKKAPNRELIIEEIKRVIFFVRPNEKAVEFYLDEVKLS